MFSAAALEWRDISYDNNIVVCVLGMLSVAI